MSKIKIKLKNPGNVIEDLKRTKVRCECTECINNNGWQGRIGYTINGGRCFLDDVHINADGECEEHQIEPKPREHPNGATLVSDVAIEAMQNHADLLGRVIDESEYEQPIDRHSISKELFEKIEEVFRKNNECTTE